MCDAEAACVMSDCVVTSEEQTIWCQVVVVVAVWGEGVGVSEHFVPGFTSWSGLKGVALYHPVGFVKAAEELFLLLVGKEAGLCRSDVL